MQKSGKFLLIGDYIADYYVFVLMEHFELMIYSNGTLNFVFILVSTSAALVTPCSTLQSVTRLTTIFLEFPTGGMLFRHISGHLHSLHSRICRNVCTEIRVVPMS